MKTSETELLNSVVNRTQSELILFFIIMVIAMVIVLIPLFALVMKERKEKNKNDNIKQDKYIEREKEIIRVIKANSEVMSTLKITLEMNVTLNTAAVNRIHERIDQQQKGMSEIYNELGQIKLILRDITE